MNKKSKIWWKKIAIFGGSALWDSIAVTPFLKNLKLCNNKSDIYYITANQLWIHQLKNVPYIKQLLCVNKKKIFSLLRFFFILIFWKFNYIIFDQSFYCFPTIYKRVIKLLTPFSKHIAFERKNNEKYFDKVIDCLEQEKNIILQYKEIIEYIYPKNKEYDSNLEIFLNYKNEITFIKKLFANNNISKNEKLAAIFLSWDNIRKTPSWIIHRSWDNDKWIEVVKCLYTKWFKTFLIWWKDNIESAKYVKHNAKCDFLFDLTWILTIEQSAAIISMVDIFLCTDSWPMYIAMWFKKKTIALLHTWAPNFDSYISNPIRNKNVQNIKANDVIAEIQKCI